MSLFFLRCERCQKPLRLVDEEMAGAWGHSRCPERKFFPLSRHLDINPLELSGCDLSSYNWAVKIQEQIDFKKNQESATLPPR